MLTQSLFSTYRHYAEDLFLKIVYLDMQYDFDEIVERKNTDSYKYDFADRYFGTDRLIPMWVADMDFRTPDFILDAIRERTKHEILGYSLKPDSLFRAMGDWYKTRQGWEISREHLLFTPGVVPALSMAVRAFTREGDKVILQPPVYHPFFSVIRENGRVPLYNQLLEENGTYKMDLEGLKKNLAPEARLLILSHPHNPVGRVWSREELEALAGICLENGIVIVSDEIHSDLVFPPGRHIPLQTLAGDLAVNTVSCIAASKTFNLAGLSTSAVVIPDEKLRSAFDHVLSTGHLHMGNIFGTVAMEAAYARGHAWVNQLLDYLKGNLYLLSAFVENNLPGIHMFPVEATYMAWLDMRELGMKPKELREFMIRQARIGCNDGPTFGPGGQGFQRLNFACPRSVLVRALDQLEQALRKRI